MGVSRSTRSAHPGDPALEVTVIRSTKRRKTAQARLVDGRLEVRIPARSSKADEARLVEQFRRRFERSTTAKEVDLAVRARRLARVHDLPRPSEIRWVGNQDQRWGSCTPTTGVIRISDRLAGFPLWVLDLVIVHELAHLVERGHDARFAALVARYPLAERAEGYLLAMSGGTDPTADPLAHDLDDDRDRPGDQWAEDRRVADLAGEAKPIALGPGGSGSLSGPQSRARRPPGSAADGSPPLPFPD